MENQEILYLIKGIERDLKKIKDGITPKPKIKRKPKPKAEKTSKKKLQWWEFY